MKRVKNWGITLVILYAVLWISTQGDSAEKIVNLAPPRNIQAASGENAIAVTWEDSPDEAKVQFAGYNVYFDLKSSPPFSPDSLAFVVQVKKGVNEYVVNGLDNNQQYFLHVCSRQTDGGVSEAGLPETAAIPQSDGKKFTIPMFDYDVSTAPSSSGYGWSRENGQDIPGHHNEMQRVKYIDILMMESPTAKGKSIFISPAEADFTKEWPVRNKTLIADIGTDWRLADPLPDAAFTTSAEIRYGHVYLIKTHDNYYVKLRIESVEEMTLYLPYGQKRSSVDLNKINFTYASQLGQSYDQFLSAKP
ncbi:MAG: fibronectin type III domain-containing protein [Calditrichaeota bacterium]|nr:MAG: fibronectin type III domain-containing protein [Calditrichota bacterium]